MKKLTLYQKSILALKNYVLYTGIFGSAISIHYTTTTSHHNSLIEKLSNLPGNMFLGLTCGLYAPFYKLYHKKK